MVFRPRVCFHGVDGRHSCECEGDHAHCEQERDHAYDIFDYESSLCRHDRMLAFQSPVLDVADYRPTMAMRVDELVAEVQAVAHEVGVVDVGQPDAGEVALLGFGAGRTVPLDLLPFLDGSIGGNLALCGVNVGVDNGV